MSSPGEHGAAEEDDAAIIGESLRDPERFAVIFDRHAPHIQRYLARRLGREIADDLVGETFLIAFGKRERYERKVPDARPWLYGIATNLVGQRRREEVREYRLRHLKLAPPPAESCHADRVAAQVTAQAMSELLAVALAGLSEGDRDVLLLIAWEGLSYDEVSVALAIPIGTVRSRLNRARKKVRDVLARPERVLSEEVSSNG
jgi:RNA polymerase sigma factor (sigma-70 family)